MFTHRIIPCLDVKAGRVVKGVNFVGLRDAGDPVEIARQYDEQGADELVFLDIAASHEGRGTMREVVRRVAEQCFMPFTVGGGIRTIADVTALIQAGAEKVSINTAAVVDPGIITQTSRRFGRCATVVNIDPKRVPRAEYKLRRIERAGRGEWVAPPDAVPGDIAFEVHTHGGRTPVGLEAVAWARRVVELGAGEIVLTSMDADGTKAGYDLELTRAGGGGGGRAGGRQRRVRLAGPHRRRAPARQSGRRPWPRASSTTASTPSPRRNATSRSGARRCESSGRNLSNV